MSRTGKQPVEIPDGVEVAVAGQTVTAKGRLGERSLTMADEVVLDHRDRRIVVRPRNESKRARALWGTSRSLLDSLVHGIHEGFTVNLEIVGVGYRAAVEGDALALQLGFSHDVRYHIPDGITIACERPTLIAITGADKQQVGQVAAEIRAYRRPEPYKGKGIRYAGERVRQKEGKKK